MNDGQADPTARFPEPLPADEAVLWQGSPGFGRLAIQAFHARKVALYFAALAAWRGGAALADGSGPAAATLPALWLLAIGAAAVSLLLLLAWLHARATTYTITSRRLILQVGVAMPVTINLPFSRIQSADLRHYGDGRGDIPLALVRTERVPWWVLWPHVRPWRLLHPAPMLRAVPGAAEVAQTLAAALARSLPADQVNAPRSQSRDALAPDPGQRLGAPRVDAPA